MAKDKKMVEEITSMKKISRSGTPMLLKRLSLQIIQAVKGFVVLKPYGFGIWENISENP